MTERRCTSEYGGAHGAAADARAAVCAYLAETSQIRTVEAYPVEPPRGRKAGPDTAMTGFASAFTAAGFAEVAGHTRL